MPKHQRTVPISKAKTTHRAALVPSAPRRKPTARQTAKATTTWLRDVVFNRDSAFRGKEQKRRGVGLDKAGFKRLVRHKMKQAMRRDDMRIMSDALELLATIAVDYLKDLYRHTNACTGKSAQRKKLMPKDVKAMAIVRGLVHEEFMEKTKKKKRTTAHDDDEEEEEEGVVDDDEEEEESLAVD